MKNQTVYDLTDAAAILAATLLVGAAACAAIHFITRFLLGLYA